MDFNSAVYLAAFVFLLYVQPSFSFYTREAGLVFDFYPEEKLSLPNDLHGIEPNKSVSVQDKMDCVFACINHPWCRSVNFQTTLLKSGLYFCQLLAYERFTRKKYMKRNKLYHHYSIKNPCQENPCRNGGECIFQSNRQEYHCNCTTDFMGQQCETVQIWSSWSAWESCDCGMTSRNRSCQIDACVGPILEKKNCSMVYPTVITKEGKPCAFPFMYGGVCYSACTTVDNGGVYWCSYDTVYKGASGTCPP